MDLITHGIMGGALAQCGFHKSLGRKAVLYGALGAMLPDLDIISEWIGGPLVGMKYHRWISHSLWFGPVVGFLWGWFLSRTPARQSQRILWIALLILTITTHPLLDLFTSYGTQLWAPFSDQRCALDAISIVDLSYTGPLLVACLIGFMFKRYPNLVQGVSLGAFALSCSYLAYGLKINKESKIYAHDQWVETLPFYDHLRSYPMLFQINERHMVARSGKTICVSFLNVDMPKLFWRCVPQLPSQEAITLINTPVGQRFDWFTDGDYRAEVLPDATLRFYDLRYPLEPGSLQGLWGVEGSCHPVPVLSYFREKFNWSLIQPYFHQWFQRLKNIGS